MDGELKYIHVDWIPAIHAGMTSFVTLMYNDESYILGISKTPKVLTQLDALISTRIADDDILTATKN
jgi:hypothetical protein